MDGIFIISQKNKKKLIDENNYVYEEHKHDLKKTYWRCECFYKGCKARVHTSNTCSDIIHSSGSHNHPASAASIAARKSVNTMKHSIHKSRTVPTREAIATAVAGLSTEAQAQLPNVPLRWRVIYEIGERKFQAHQYYQLQGQDLKYQVI